MITEPFNSPVCPTVVGQKSVIISLTLSGRPGRVVRQMHRTLFLWVGVRLGKFVSQLLFLISVAVAISIEVFAISIAIAVAVDAASSPTFAYTVEITNYCTSTQIATDITNCAQQAINAAAPKNSSFGGGIVHFPADLGPYILLGTLQVPFSFVKLDGDSPQGTFISCKNGANDCITIGNNNSPTRGQAISNLGIFGQGKTGGNGVIISNTFNVNIENVILGNMVNGIDFAGANNTMTLRNVMVSDNQPNSQYGIYWHDRADGTSRSDALAISNVIIEGNWSNATGFLWDGGASTVTGSTLRILHQQYGMRIMNSAHSQSHYPAFLNIFDLELEGFKLRALEIDGGADFRIVGSDINNLLGNSTPGSKTNSDEQAIAILADTGYSYTRGISIVNSRIGDSHLAGLYSEAVDVQLTNDVFFSTQGGDNPGAPVINLAPSSRDVLLNNIRCEEFGGLGYASYCLQVSAGAQGIIANVIDARYVRIGAINDLGSKGASYVSVLQPNGQAVTLLK